MIESNAALPGLGRKLVVVDDDCIQRTLVKARLELAGFRVTTASGATEALRLVANTRPDAIVSDVLMDELDGFSLCRVLRSDQSLSRVPIVLLSSYFDEVADTALAREVGADALVMRSPELQECIEVLIKSFADAKPAPAPGKAASELYVRRVAHQLVRLRQDTLRAEAHYHALFEHARDAVSILTPDGRIVDVNRRWEEIMQRPREELVGLHIRDFSNPSDAVANSQRFRESMERNVERDGPVPISRPDGSTILMEFTTAKFDLDGSENVLAIGRDVTEVVESRLKLEASERKYRSLVENIPEVVWSLSADGKLRFVSSNSTRVCGFTPEELLDGSYGPTFSRVHPQDVGPFREAVAVLFSQQGALDTECRWQHKDGRWLWLHFRAVRAQNDDGVESIDGVFSDVTARKQLEEQLMQSQKVETIGQLTAGIAHDFNNVLAVIIANSDYLAQTLRDKDDKEIAQEIVSTTRRAIDLTRGLLTFARREATEPCELDLNATIATVQRMLVCTLGRGVELDVSLATHLDSMHADPRQLEQVLMNLAVNARDAMPKGGKLTIETANVDVAPGEAGRDGLPRPGHYVALSVSDTGTGMSAETRERIFEPFFTTKGERGTGLGLSTSYGIVRRFGGHIAVDSEPGKGTTFRIYFPRAAATRSATEARTPRSSRRPGRTGSVALDSSR